MEVYRLLREPGGPVRKGAAKIGVLPQETRCLTRSSDERPTGLLSDADDLDARI